MPGRAHNKLFEVAADRYGYLTQHEALEAGYSKDALQKMAKRGTLDRVAWGLYRFAALPRHELDQYMEATLWPRPAQGVLSHETALDLHDLCDVNPGRLHVTVPKSYRTNRAVPKLYALHRRDLVLHEIGSHEGIPIVTPLRAILDGIEGNVRAGLVEQAIDSARRRGLLRPDELKLVERRAGPRAAPPER